jgi:hypothetical protein
LFFSPQKTFQLPTYAKAATQAYAHSLSPSYDSDRFSGDRRVWEFLDISADGDNDRLEEHFLDVSNASNSMSRSVLATSYNSSPSSTNNVVSHSKCSEMSTLLVDGTPNSQPWMEQFS